MPETTINTNSGVEKAPNIPEKESELKETIMKKPKRTINLFSMSHNFLAPVYISFLLVIVLFTVGSYLIKIYKDPLSDTVTVIGTSSQQVLNDIASFNATVQSQNSDKQTAVDDVTSRSQEIIEFASNYGIPKTDIKTASINVFQMRDSAVIEGQQTLVPGEWVATISVEMKYRDVGTVEKFGSDLASLEGVEIYGPSFEKDKNAMDESMLLEQALLNAKQKAEFLAKSSGNRLGNIVSINEGYIPSYGPVSLRSEGFGGGGGIPMEPGSTEATKTLVVTYRLR